MCLIIQGKPKHFTKEIIKKAFNQNPHGFGLMYLDKDTNRVITKKFFTKKINKIQKVCKEHFKKADEIALHFRITTQGNTNNKNCHPFQVLNQDNDSCDLFLMHNSPRLPAPLLNKEMSDSYFFSKTILRPIVKRDYKLLKNEKFIDCIEKITQAEMSSRVLLLDNFTNSFQFLGSWSEHKNLKYSNDNIIPNTNYWNKGYSDNVYYDRSYKSDYSAKKFPKIKVQEKELISDVVDSKELSDFVDLIAGYSEDEIKKLVDDNSETVARLLFANSNGYDIQDSSDLKVFVNENYNSGFFDDLKPYGSN